MITAACYIRVSTDDQTEYSPDSQLKLIRDYCTKNKISLSEDLIFAEDGGKSGKNMTKRTEFMRLISLTKSKPKPFDVLLVWKFSRFARNQEESIVLKSMLKKRGIDVISVSETIPDGPFGSLIERIIEWSDEYYLVNLSQEVKRGMKERASRGEPVTPPPIGYRMKDGGYVPDSDADAIKKIYEDFLAGIGMRAIARKYSDLGLRTKKGNELDNRTVEYILCNPVYTGKIRWSKEGRAASKRHYSDPNVLIFDGKHEPIVDIALFDKVQKKLEEQKKRYGKYQRQEQQVRYMSKGLVRCGSCGATLVASYGKTPTLQCHNYARGSCKVSHSISIEKLDSAIKEYLAKVSVTGDFKVTKAVHEAKTADKQSTDYSKILKNEYVRLERIKQAYQSGIDSLEEYKVNKAKALEFIEYVKAEKAAAEAAAKETEISNKTAKERYRTKIQSVTKIINDKTATPAAKNAALRSILSKIVLEKPENTLDFYFYD